MKSIVGESLRTNFKSAQQLANTALKGTPNEFILDEIYNFHRIIYKECIYKGRICKYDSLEEINEESFSSYSSDSLKKVKLLKGKLCS